MPQNGSPSGSPILTDGSLNFKGGVNSDKPTTVATEANPDGLGRNQLAWLINATVEGGCIQPRGGWDRLYKMVDILAPALAGTIGYQGGYLYRPLDGFPYLIFSVGGFIYRADPDLGTPVLLSTTPALRNPANVDHAYFVQGEQFLVIQAGDGVTLPLFWDGTTLRRSVGIQNQSAFTVISTDPQHFTVPLLGGTLALTWSSTAGLAVGDTVQLSPHPTNPAFIGQISWGQYKVTNIAAGVVTMTKLDFNAGVFNVSTFPHDLLRVNGVPPPSELPPAYAMDYYMGRIWYVFGDLRTYTAGDIVGSTVSGTLAYNFTDSILKVTENPLAVGGDGFHIPADAGNIRALTHTAQLNEALGQGMLYIFTRKQVFSLKVPVSRADWINANSTNAPLQTCVQITNGSTGDRCIVPVNGDLYYQSLEPSIRSLIIAVRNFGQPGNLPLSAPENRIMQFNNRELLSFASGIEFTNWLIQTALPERVPQGVIHKALIPYDFSPLYTPNSSEPPVWEGHYEGLDFLQLFTGDYGGRQRAFAIVVGREDGGIWLWELTERSLTEDDDKRIAWQIEFPAFNFTEDFTMKKLVGGELWLDRLSGTAEFNLEYRPDGYSCYIPWLQWKLCSARDCEENIPTNCPPLSYPPTPIPQKGLGYRQTVGFPEPAAVCDTQMGRPSNIGHQFQCRLTIKGSCRIRGFFVHGTRYERKLYDMLPC